MKGVHCEHSLPLFPWGLEVHHLLSAVSFNLSLYLSFLFLLTNCGFQKTSERAALLKRKCLKPAWLQGEPCWRLKSDGENAVFSPVVQNPKDVEIKPSEKLLKWETGTQATKRQSKPQEAPSKQNHMAISAEPSRDGFFSYPAPACALSKRLVTVPAQRHPKWPAQSNNTELNLLHDPFISLSSSFLLVPPLQLFSFFPCLNILWLTHHHS